MKRTQWVRKPTVPMKRGKLRKKSKESIHSCKWCKKEFSFIRYPSGIKGGHKGIFCTMICQVNFLKSKAFNFPCKICGITVFTQPAQIKLRNRQTCSLVCRGKMKRILAEKRRVDLGYTKHQLDRLARYSPEAQNWRISVFKRDNYTCLLCGVRGTYIEADHIKPWAYFPELRYDLNNGRTLCRPCHDITKIGYKKMREIYAKTK